MPFLKTCSKELSRSRQKEQMTLKSGLRHTVFSLKGDKYKGEWKDNQKHGKGVLQTPKGEVYEGDWECNYRHGYCILSVRLPNGTFERRYVGDWIRGKRQGMGISYFPDGSYYEGEFENGKRHGHGRIWFTDISYYEGQWAGNKFHGLGIFVQSNGNRYEGEWHEGLKQGRGIFYHLDSGQKQEGVWVNGIAVSSTMIDIYFRQSGYPPTEYPIPRIELEDPQGVVLASQNSVLENINHLKPPEFESGIRELRLLVWADQVTTW